MTAAIGIMMGIGFYIPAVMATGLSLITLSLFRWVEARLPSHTYAHFSVRFDRANVMTEETLVDFLRRAIGRVEATVLADPFEDLAYELAGWPDWPDKLSSYQEGDRVLRQVLA